MKTTLDIPDYIMRQAKIRAAEEGRKLKDVVAEALRTGLALALPAMTGSKQINVVSDPKTGLPVVAAITKAVGSSLSRQEIRDLEAGILDREEAHSPNSLHPMTGNHPSAVCAAVRPYRPWH